MRKNYFVIRCLMLIFFFSLIVLNVSAQTNFSNLGSDNSGGSGYKTILNNSNIVVSNIMVNDGSEMYHSSTDATGYTTTFTIKANGTSTNTFNFLGMNFRGYILTTVDAANSSIVFKDIDGITLQTMTLNSNKNLSTSSTNVASFFDNGTTVPVNNVAEIIFRIYRSSGQDNQQNSANITLVDITLSDYALPVELTSFTANLIKGNVNLKWKTATEVNNFGFEIQRFLITSKESINSGEELWEKAGFVRGYGSSNSPKDYSFTEKPIGGNKFKYRLKQIDIDGQYEYSTEVEVGLDIVAEYSVKQNFPNPFNPTTKIQFSIPSENNVEIKVFNVLGMEEATLLNENKQAGIHSVEFSASNLSSGVYFYKVVSGNYSEIKKMVLLR